MISKEKIRAALERMANLGIEPEDLVESFIRGSGRGGQKINKTASCVRLKHVPSGLEVRCHAERSLAINRYLARTQLCDKFERRADAAEQQKRAAAARRKRQNRRRSAAEKAGMLRDKLHRGAVKVLRRKPAADE